MKHFPCRRFLVRPNVIVSFCLMLHLFHSREKMCCHNSTVARNDILPRRRGRRSPPSGSEPNRFARDRPRQAQMKRTSDRRVAGSDWRDGGSEPDQEALHDAAAASETLAALDAAARDARCEAASPARAGAGGRGRHTRVSAADGAPTRALMFRSAGSEAAGERPASRAHGLRARAVNAPDGPGPTRIGTARARGVFRMPEISRIRPGFVAERSNGRAGLDPRWHRPRPSGPSLRKNRSGAVSPRRRPPWLG
jgi:hypothetical protein